MLEDLIVFNDYLILIVTDRGHYLQSVLEHKIPNPAHRAIENWKMYATKQIKICTEYRDMVPKASTVLSGTPGLRSIGLNPKPPWPWVTCPGILYRY